jgi:hypothetical protein
VGSRPITDLIDPGRVYRLFEEGATVVLQGLHRYWQPVTAFCRDLELTLTHPMQANAYLTPPVASGLNVHADGHDVFALQTHGTKHWVTYPPADLAGSEGAGQVPGSGRDLELRPGECLYVPRGSRHAARTVATASIHLTVGVRAVTWRDLLRSELEGALREALDEPQFDDALPARFAERSETLAGMLAPRLAAVAERLGKVDPAAAADAACRRFWSARPPLLAGQLGQLLRLEATADDSTVRRRPGAVCRLQRDDGRLTLQLGDRALRAPARLEPALRFVVERERFAVADLAEHLDEHARVVLVRRLIREGLLVADRPAPAPGDGVPARG